MPLICGFGAVAIVYQHGQLLDQTEVATPFACPQVSKRAQNERPPSVPEGRSSKMALQNSLCCFTCCTTELYNTANDPVQGLRVHDNPALLEALKDCKHLYPVFVFDPWFAGNGK